MKDLPHRPASHVPGAPLGLAHDPRTNGHIPVAQHRRLSGRWLRAVTSTRGIFVAALLSSAVCGLTLVILGSVSTRPTDEDRVYGDRILAAAGVMPPGVDRTYEEQLRFIRDVQRAVEVAAPRLIGIPQGVEREPRDVFERKQGLCYDRSRAIEKILQTYGFETRHVSIFVIEPGASSWSSVLTPGSPSHAASEVRTTRGWMLVDSLYDFIGIDPERNPMDLAALAGGKGEVHADVAYLRSHFYQEPIVFVRGLYSRHGTFFPPFVPVPDVAWSEIASNF
jgi:hypothetical protein